MSFLIDTNICSAYVKGKPEIFTAFQQYWGRLFVSSVTVGELTTWSLRSSLAPATREALNSFLLEFPCLSVDQAVGVRYGELRAQQLDRGSPVPIADLLIAATALVHDFTVVTHNKKDFASIAGLRVVDWLTS